MNSLPDEIRRSLVFRGMSLAALALFGGCQTSSRTSARPVGQLAVDIHSHVFNGRDVPVVGFLQQTILRDPHQEVDPSELSTAFLNLLARILLSGTPTADAELVSLRRRGLRRRLLDRALAEDETNVAAALEATALEAQAAATGRSANESQLLLSRLAVKLQVQRARIATPATAQQEARVLAARIYERAPNGRVQGGANFRFLGGTIQTIRWAGLLTRSRSDILAELISLYGSRISIYSPSIVDFERWFVSREQAVSEIRTQIDLFSELAARTRQSLVLNFAPFCPLRAALDREDDPGTDPLANVRYAILERGFAGVKLYPPMGFRPIGNNSDVSRWAPRAPRAGGMALDRELELLYKWCVENEVPIKAHANNSVAAGPNTGRFADPSGWERVLRRHEFRDLQLNLAHFGGFDESEIGGSDWEETMAQLTRAYPNVYFDLGFWSEAAGLGSGDRDRVIARATGLIERNPGLTNRMMYGSDWSMIGRIPRHHEYLARLEAVIGRMAPSDESRDGIMGLNALRYLGLDRPGRQRARLNSFFASHPVYRRVVEATSASSLGQRAPI